MLALAMVRAVDSACKRALAESFQQNFEKVLLPGFERGLQSMFTQLNQTLASGLQQGMMNSAASSSSDENVSALRREVAELSQAVAGMRSGALQCLIPVYH